MYNQKQLSISNHFNIFITLADIKHTEVRKMPARKVKNDNKEKQLMEKMESINDKKEGTIEQINI